MTKSKSKPKINGTPTFRQKKKRILTFPICVQQILSTGYTVLISLFQFQKHAQNSNK